MTSKEIEAEITNLEVQAEDLKAEYRDAIDLYTNYQEDLLKINNRHRKLKKQLVETKLDENPDDIAFLINYDYEGETSKSHTVLDNLAKQHGLRHHGGYWVKTMQLVLKIQLNHHQDYHETLEGIKFFLPFIKPDEDGYAHFDIFEHTLSQYGSYTLKVKPNVLTGAIIMCNRRVNFSGTLEAALRQISEVLWYE